MSTMTETISDGLKLIDEKKQNLRTTFEDLQVQAQSSSLLSFNLTWVDIDSYFNSLQSSLQTKFESLQKTLDETSRFSQPQQHLRLRTSGSSSDESSEFDQVPARAALKTICREMDVLGLMKLLAQRPRKFVKIRAELPDAWRHSPDASAIVLNVMERVHGENSLKTFKRRNCMTMVADFMKSGLGIGAQTKEKAKRLAVEWKRKLGTDKRLPLLDLGFLQLLSTFGIIDMFNVDDIIDIIVHIQSYESLLHLCSRSLLPADKVSDLIQKLIMRGRLLMAFRFSFEFDLTEKFKPVDLLKAYVERSKKLAENLRENGNNAPQLLSKATSKELGSLKSVIRYIDKYGLESDYPKAILLKRISEIQRKKSKKTFLSLAVATNPQQRQMAQQRARKRRRYISSIGPARNQTSVTPIQRKKSEKTLLPLAAATNPHQ